MTQPIAHGYPDYGRFRALSDVGLVNFVEDTLAASKDYGPFFTATLPFVALVMSADAVRARYTLIWSADALGTEILARDSATVPAASVNTLVFPVLGPYLTIRTELAAYPNVHGLRAFHVSNPASVTNDDGLGTTLFNTGFVNIAPATGQTHNALKVFAGEIYCFSYCDGTSGYIQLSLTDLGSSSTIWTFTSTKSAGEGTVQRWKGFVPALPLQALLQNNDGSARNFQLYMIGRPLHGGR